MILYYRNEEKRKSRRFLCLDSSIYDKHNISLDEFKARAEKYAMSWGYPIACDEKEYSEYKDVNEEG